MLDNHTAALEKQRQLADMLARLGSELFAQSMGEVLHILQEANLSLPRLVALTYLKRAGTATISELSEHLNLALGTTSHLVDQLVQSGYVERREGADDRRQKQVRLTDAGQDLVAQVRRARSDEIVRRLSELPPDLIERFSMVLDELLVALSLPQLQD